MSEGRCRGVVPYVYDDDDDDHDDDVDDEDDAVEDGRMSDKASLEHSGIRNSLKTKKIIAARKLQFLLAKIAFETLLGQS